ncbi:MAG TPA: DUF6603 domain-containing protein [Gemmatimonadaceae bacterium]|nr:DUF6603 domain-containing protein [Gemmatimonadaceae bacterium]
MAGESTIELLVRELTLAVGATQRRLASGNAFRDWMGELGWDVPAPAVQPLADLQQSLAALLGTLAQIDPDVPVEDQASVYTELLFQLPEFITALRDLANAVPAGGGVPPEFFLEAPKQIADDVVVTHLEVNRPALFGFLRVFGLIEVAPQPAQGGRPAFISRDLRLDRIGTLLRDPKQLLDTLYAWGHDNFDADLFFTILQLFTHAFGIPARRFLPPASLTRYLYPTLTADELVQLRLLQIPVYEVADDQVGFGEIGVSILPILHDQLVNNVRPMRGIAFQPFARGGAATEISLGGPFSLILGGAIGVDLLIEIRQAGVTVSAGDGSGNLVSFDAMAKLGLKASGQGKPLILFGEAGKTRLEMKSASVTLTAIASESDFEFNGEFELEDLRLIVSTAGGDGFISKILPVSPLEIEVDLVIGWSSSRGVYFRGSAALEVTVPVHKTIGPLTLDSIFLRIEVGAADGKIPITLAVTGSAVLGPISAAVNKIGLIATASFPDDGDGDIGPVDLDFAFKPPDGVGLAINAEAIKGGGYLLIDRENERYAGMLNLAFGEISLTAIGLITTRMPDGSKGFSLLAIIAVTFDPAITLGYGFFLKGVGGLLGFNRTMNLEAIERGVRTGTLDSIMFPADPVANAAKIISDLEAVFPAQRDRLVIGPMVMITWGVPTIITGELAIIIEVPMPIRIAILGQVSMILPTPTAAILKLQLDVAGLIDFGKGTLSIDASLRDSKLLVFTLTGDAAVRLRWGNDANFAMAAGGWHANYTPPPGFPSLRRLRISLGDSDNPRLELESYFALTPNTIQFGARLALEARAGDFSIEGYFSFDTLFIFSPFSFEAELRAGVSVKAGSRRLMTIRLEGKLEGPAPWRARGRASFEILWIEVSVKFDTTFGRRDDTRLPPIDLWQPLTTALAEPGNWITALAPGTMLFVSLREDTPANMLLAAPIGEVTVRQRIAPLRERITKAGNAEPPSPVTFDVTAGASGFSIAPVTEPFAMATFQRRSDHQRLTGKPFEDAKAGVTITGDVLRIAPYVARDITFEEIVLDDVGRRRTVGSARLPRDHARMGIAVSAVMLDPLGMVERRFGGELPNVGVEIGKPGWEIVSSDDLLPAAGTAELGGVMSHSTASALLDHYNDTHPWDVGRYQVIPTGEVPRP